MTTGRKKRITRKGPVVTITRAGLLRNNVSAEKLLRQEIQKTEQYMKKANERREISAPCTIRVGSSRKETSAEKLLWQEIQKAAQYMKEMIDRRDMIVETSCSSTRTFALSVGELLTDLGNRCLDISYDISEHYRRRKERSEDVYGHENLVIALESGECR